MNTLKHYWRFWIKNFKLELQTEMMYKTNLFFKIIGFVLADIIGPLVALLIYGNTAGIPGWTLEQFILFQGSFILVFGTAHLLFLSFPWRMIDAVRDGSFDKYLVKPIRPLIQLTLSSWDIEGGAEVVTGLALIIWSMLQLDITLGGVLLFIVLILVGLLFVYSMMVVIAASTFLVVKSHALFNIFFKLIDFGRYPLTIYEGGLRVFLTFIFPVGVVAFYPAEAVLVTTAIGTLLKVTLPVGALFGLSLLLWKRAMKKYASAGG